ncbi:MAG: pyruvate dehydrogenase (acetyl-transferring) E1 component subunit alpha [Angustibacter sp.]
MSRRPARTATAPQPAAPTSVDADVQLLRTMLRIRRFEEKCAELYSAGKIRGFLHLYIGEEAVATGVLPELGPDDAIVATYREHGHALVRGVPMRALMAEMFGKVEGCSHGRGGSMHLFDVSRRFYGGQAIVGAGLPTAVGLALADRMLGRSGRVTACFFGDGAVAEGVFHETANLAALWHLPVLLCCENNRYAMGTAIERYESQTDLCLKAAAYEIPAWPVDGMDVLAVRDVARRAVEAVRGGGPLFLELQTYRYRAHSMYDPDRYRERSEIEQWKQRDPIATFAASLRERELLDDAGQRALEDEVAAEVADAVEYAEAGHLEPVDELTRWVHSEVTP